MGKWEPISDEVIKIRDLDEESPEDMQVALFEYMASCGFIVLEKREAYAIVRDDDGIDWYIHTGLDGEALLMQPGKYALSPHR